ncbi:hypothetical protein HFO39_22275 [Rhizobium leguminosarum]|uniref:hypothetical protein n=1 Tax=Rhizobium TaxID=379 RepID=UPI001A917DA5|nr:MULTISPECIES: hypothetical protein [Rhizobium]MBY3121475.1 hypothetical protein [Rhizobium laguerreae]MBY3131781.1 hypothetical protein [Rhizobium laguerreae]MBY5555751.1 hypothetical protein [Rhizobium leguminosarum]MBY5637462.1 hypothetical protein [Rhizobium leguminosarum]MBY5747427.1 hypothetical protein [Rhizobium leguminosarum]
MLPPSLVIGARSASLGSLFDVSPNSAVGRVEGQRGDLLDRAKGWARQVQGGRRRSSRQSPFASSSWRTRSAIPGARINQFKVGQIGPLKVGEFPSPGSLLGKLSADNLTPSPDCVREVAVFS